MKTARALVERVANTVGFIPSIRRQLFHCHGL